LLLIVLYLNPMSIKTRCSEILPPEKIQSSRRWNCFMIKVAQQSKLKVCHEPVSSSRRDFLYFNTANGSSVVWHLDQSCLDRLENVSEYTSFLVLKNILSLHIRYECEWLFYTKYLKKCTVNVFYYREIANQWPWILSPV